MNDVSSLSLFIPTRGFQAVISLTVRSEYGSVTAQPQLPRLVDQHYGLLEVHHNPFTMDVHIHLKQGGATVAQFRLNHDAHVTWWGRAARMIELLRPPLAPEFGSCEAPRRFNITKVRLRPPLTCFRRFQPQVHPTDRLPSAQSQDDV